MERAPLHDARVGKFRMTRLSKIAQLRRRKLESSSEEPSTGVPKMDLGRTDFHVRRVARAREREETPNWSPPEHVVLFNGISGGNV